MAATRPTVYTIPAGAPFVDVLARGLIDRYGGDPLAFSRVTVLLPTRRACRSLREAFLRVSDGQAILLPVLRPLGDLGEEEGLPLTGPAPLPENDDNGGGDPIPPAITDMFRLFLLARFIRARADTATRLDQAVHLAAELAALLDQVQTERLDFAALAELVPEEYASHWQLTLAFLTIVTEQWPAILADLGVTDPAARRNAVLEAVARAWSVAPPADPVIAAGSTGSIPATADLLATIARMPSGAVVLPGLDRDLDDAVWSMLDPVHPQYGLHQLLHHMDVARSEVEDWQAGLAPAPRAGFVVHAMRPADAPSDQDGSVTDDVLAGLSVVEAPGLREESLVIALAMRRALEDPGKTVALVTPDRTLARRVTTQLDRWDIAVDDSAGTPLDHTVPGAFLLLTADLVASGCAPVAFLAACKHPLAAGGQSPGAFKALARQVEQWALRGPRPAPGFAGLAAALAAHPAATQAAMRWLAGLSQAAAPFAAALEAEDESLTAILRHHVAFAEWLAADDSQVGACRLWAGETGEAAASLVNQLIEEAGALGTVRGAEYQAFLATVFGRAVVRPRYGRHPRLHIWGPLEARLQQADLMIVGGLNEGTWPADPGADPWMSRPMRHDFGLPAQERRIGLAAHDFQQIVCAGNVLLTRSTKVDGTPTVPSRWWVRLQTALQAAGTDLPKTDGAALLAIGEVLDGPGGEAGDGLIGPAPPPEPRPPLEARPRRLSVTQVETWVRDPYAVYARHILALKALEPIDAAPDAAGRGTAIHAALERFVRDTADGLPGDALDRLLAYGREAFGAMLDRPAVRAFWWPRFERIAQWFLEQESDRRRTIATLATEVSGEMQFAGPAGPFTLRATADRIDRLPGGGLAIIDYKTGAAPSKTDLETGYAPQLPLEAAMASAGAFTGIGGAGVDALSVWRLSGVHPAGEIKDYKVAVADVAEEARAGLQSFIALFDNPATPYFARPKPDVAPRFSDYEHLARLKEWALGDHGGDHGGDGGDGP